MTNTAHNIEEKILPHERRHYVRSRIPIMMSYQFIQEDLIPFERTIATAKVWDISAGGLCLLLNNLPASIVKHLTEKGHSHLLITLDLPIQTEIWRILGRVAWTSKQHATLHHYRMGISFLNISPEEGSLLVQTVKKQHNLRFYRHKMIVAATLAGVLFGIFLGRIFPAF